ncbi:MAG TPA: hypothetical protein VGC84_05440 [Ilumatobacteraceae bacterium]|jgi:hypothetical protein
MKLRTKCAGLVALVATSLPGVATANASTPTTQDSASAASIATVSSWKTVVMDHFDSGGVPSHWRAYNGPYGSGSKSCALPSHNTVSGGSLHLKMYYESSSTAGKCGAAWYSGGLTLSSTYSSVSQRVTVRFRVVQSGGIVAHRIIPMRWPDAGNGYGEEDYCESTSNLYCSTFLHWRDWAGRDRKKYFLSLNQWHTFTVERNGYHVRVQIDGGTSFDFTGNSTSLPGTLKHVVLQQECNKLGCPLTKSGNEDIQIDWIKIENPA